MRSFKRVETFEDVVEFEEDTPASSASGDSGGLRTGQTVAKDGDRGDSRLCAVGFLEYKLGKICEYNV